MAIELAGALRRCDIRGHRVSADLAERVRRCLSGAADTWVWILLVVALVAIQAIRLPSDTDWDLRNYHLYNAHALINGRFWTDIAAAQLQTFMSPVMDIALGAVRDGLDASPVLRDLALSIPHAVAVVLAFVLTLRVLPHDLPARAPLALAAILCSAGGAAGYPTLATSMSEMLPACCILGGLLLLTGNASTLRGSIILAGALFGLAAGLKLTAAPYCVAASVALLVAPRPGLPRLPQAALFVLGGLLAAALVGGPWWLLLYHRYGNPIMPFLNQIFHAPFVDARAFADERFLPRNAAMALAYPFYWATRTRALVSELPLRDPRFAIACLAVGALVVQALRRGMDRGGTFLLVFFATSFALWEAQFSVLRYLATLELLSGAIVLLALQSLLQRPHLRGPIAWGFVGLCIVAQTMTVYPDWGRMARKQPMLVQLPALEANALVVLLDPSPMAYLANLLPPSVRFIGANNNLIQPGDPGLLAHQAETTIRTHTGPLYGLEDPIESPSAAARTLAYYRLRRGDCSVVISNLESNAVHLCRLWPATG